MKVIEDFIYYANAPHKYLRILWIAGARIHYNRRRSCGPP